MQSTFPIRFHLSALMKSLKNLPFRLFEDMWTQCFWSCMLSGRWSSWMSEVQLVHACLWGWRGHSCPDLSMVALWSPTPTPPPSSHKSQRGCVCLQTLLLQLHNLRPCRAACRAALILWQEEADISALVKLQLQVWGGKCGGGESFWSQTEIKMDANWQEIWRALLLEFGGVACGFRTVKQGREGYSKQTW